jgi:hypothetical protein
MQNMMREFESTSFGQLGVSTIKLMPIKARLVAAR